MRSMASLFAGLIALGSLACNHNGPTDPAALADIELDAVIGREIRLAIGESSTITGTDLTLKLLAVTEDSRCPIDALCISAGNARVNLQLQRTGQAPGTLE